MKFLIDLSVTIVFIFLWSNVVQAVVPGEIRHYTTNYSIGVEWDVSGDDNHNATCAVAFKKTGTSSWQQALPLYRVDFKEANMMAGSIFYLVPGDSYDLRLELTDPDGGGETSTLTVTTRQLPVRPSGGRTLYVIPAPPATIGGSGSDSDPFRGIASAQAEVQPGDTVILTGGDYPGEIEFTHSGEPGNYILWKGQGDELPVLETVRVNADHIWLEGLHITGDEYGIRTYNHPHDVVVTDNLFSDCHMCIYLNHGGTSWFIADNTIIGDVPPASGSFSGEGVELNHSNDHTVMYNTISRVADGVSYPGRNCDIFGNDIFDVSDDGIEPDYGYSNIRIWSNRISNAYHNGISFQPMNGAPWYLIRNQVAAPTENALKFRDDVHRALIAHNTFIGWQGVQKVETEHLLAVQSNNNLWISMTDRYAWENGTGGTPDWRTNLDYDGFDWGNYTYAMKWGSDSRYRTLEDFASATSLEQHGIRIDKESCFAKLDISAAPPASMPLQYITLKSDCNAVDAGIPLANINDDYLQDAPDLGAYEVGAPLPHYGIRARDGDINGDHMVNLVDAMIALHILVGNSTSISPYFGADINSDKNIGVAELLFILKSIANHAGSGQ